MITLTLTTDQARILRNAIDLLHRLRLGQVEEIVSVWEDRLIHEDANCRHTIASLCAAIKANVFPRFHPHESYGICSPELTKDDQRMYEIYKILDHAVWLSTPPESRLKHVVSGDDPYALMYSGDPKIPFTVSEEPPATEG